ncbi:MAG: hypothetical protein RJA05_178 [Planctomycetota bacterium]
MIPRDEAQAAIQRALRRSPIALLLGPRQCGKTTLAREFVHPGSERYFDLESPSDLARLDEPMTALAGLRGTVVIDEVQRRPDLFPMLRVLADRRPTKARFLVLGSASPQMLRQSAESLAGRVELVQLGPLGLAECGADRLERRWLRGGFPRSFLAKSLADSQAWRRDFIATIIERDLRAYDSRLAAPLAQRLWTMLAHHHGQVINLASVAGALGIAVATLRHHIDLLEGLLVIRQLQPWHENIAKRQVKSPRLYIRDTGILHSLLGLDSTKDLLGSPACGPSWESLAIEEILARVPHTTAAWWSTHQGAEIDLVLMNRGKRWGIEIKRTDAPRITPSMRSALEALRLDGISVVSPIERGFRLAPTIKVVSMHDLIADPAIVTRP